MLTYPERACDRMLHIDPNLTPFKGDILMRLTRANETMTRLVGDKNQLSDFADGYLYFGFHRTETGWVFREWLPGAEQVFLTGDFNAWSWNSHPLTRQENGVWEIVLDGKDALKHGEYVKLIVQKNGSRFERLPAYIRRAVLNPETHILAGQIWAPETSFEWTDQAFFKQAPLDQTLIYEAHIGMATEREGIGTYREFADEVLPRVARLGYTAVQLMAIQEHPYYASFGYQVTNFFAPSSHFGTPDDLRYLINKAHALGIHVLLDVVHSHASANTGEGLNQQDGTDNQYFREGSRGWHVAWQTRLFDYGKTEVLHFLLSNLKYWEEEFHFDGFRFDGVTSMIYENHGLGEAFTNYQMYYSMNTDVDALIYLTLANRLIHEVNPLAFTIAEEMSGMPGICLRIKDGGIGFDSRLAMGIPDYWIKLIKETRMEDWDMGKLWYELTTARPRERVISYAESHDQALVGDKTIIFRLADAEMYTGMNQDYHSLTIDNAIDYHKLIRFLTLASAKDGYLNFMGNEFGHPEWIDFPREGNGWSYKYARRQWSLSTNGLLKYTWLNAFDADMVHFVREHQLLGEAAEPEWIDQEKKLIVFHRKGLIFLFNLHPNQSQTDYFVSVPPDTRWKTVFSSDAAAYGGQDRISLDYVYQASPHPLYGPGFTYYLPARSAAVLAPVT